MTWILPIVSWILWVLGTVTPLDAVALEIRPKNLGQTDQDPGQTERSLRQINTVQIVAAEAAPTWNLIWADAHGEKVDLRVTLTRFPDGRIVFAQDRQLRAADDDPVSFTAPAVPPGVYQWDVRVWPLEDLPNRFLTPILGRPDSTASASQTLFVGETPATIRQNRPIQAGQNARDKHWKTLGHLKPPSQDGDSWPVRVGSDIKVSEYLPEAWVEYRPRYHRAARRWDVPAGATAQVVLPTHETPQLCRLEIRCRDGRARRLRIAIESGQGGLPPTDFAFPGSLDPAATDRVLSLYWMAGGEATFSITNLDTEAAVIDSIQVHGWERTNDKSVLVETPNTPFDVPLELTLPDDLWDEQLGVLSPARWPEDAASPFLPSTRAWGRLHCAARLWTTLADAEAADRISLPLPERPEDWKWASTILAATLPSASFRVAVRPTQPQVPTDTNLTLAADAQSAMPTAEQPGIAAAQKSLEAARQRCAAWSGQMGSQAGRFRYELDPGDGAAGQQTRGPRRIGHSPGGPNKRRLYGLYSPTSDDAAIVWIDKRNAAALAVDHVDQLDDQGPSSDLQSSADAFHWMLRCNATFHFRDSAMRENIRCLKYRPPEASLREIISSDPAISVARLWLVNDSHGGLDSQGGLWIENPAPWAVRLDIRYRHGKTSNTSSTMAWTAIGGGRIDQQQAGYLRLRIEPGCPLRLTGGDPVHDLQWSGVVAGGVETAQRLKQSVTDVVERVGRLGDPPLADADWREDFEAIDATLSPWMHSQFPVGSVSLETSGESPNTSPVERQNQAHVETQNQAFLESQNQTGKQYVSLRAQPDQSSRTWLVSPPLPLRPTDRLAISLRLQNRRAQATRVRLSIESTDGIRPIRLSREWELPLGPGWVDYPLALETEGWRWQHWNDLRCTIDLLEAGDICIDDVRIHEDFASASQRDHLKRQAFLAVQNLKRGNLTHAAKLLQNRWSMVLLDHAEWAPDSLPPRRGTPDAHSKPGTPSKPGTFGTPRAIESILAPGRALRPLQLAGPLPGSGGAPPLRSKWGNQNVQSGPAGSDGLAADRLKPDPSATDRFETGAATGAARMGPAEMGPANMARRDPGKPAPASAADDPPESIAGRIRRWLPRPLRF